MTQESYCSNYSRIKLCEHRACYQIYIDGQSYKLFTMVNYYSRVVLTRQLLIFTTLES